MLDWSRTPQRRFKPAHRRMGAGVSAPHRAPWQGQVEKAAAISQPVYDPECYLCPGNSRVGGVRNPDYTSTFVFENDFAALRPDTPVDRSDERGLLVAESEPGVCRVICFSPRHDLTVSRMEAPALRQVWTPG